MTHVKAPAARRPYAGRDGQAARPGRSPESEMMAETGFPATLARATMRLLPPPLLGAGAALLLRRMARAHPALFHDLAALPPAVLRIEPTDLPHRFVLRLGGGPPRIALAGDDRGTADACVKGCLDSLVALLEGRLDSDTAFFSRAITITGDTAVVVGLRNTLERDGIAVMAEVAALLGPLARPAQAAARRLDAIAAGARTRLIAALRDTAPPAPASAAPDLAALRGEVTRLAGRLARLERKHSQQPEDKAA